jgi:general stress protein YciG
MNDKKPITVQEAGRRGGLAKAKKGFAVSGKAREAGSKGGKKNAEKYRSAQ